MAVSKKNVCPVAVTEHQAAGDGIALKGMYKRSVTEILRKLVPGNQIPGIRDKHCSGRLFLLPQNQILFRAAEAMIYAADLLTNGIPVSGISRFNHSICAERVDLTYVRGRTNCRLQTAGLDVRRIPQRLKIQLTAGLPDPCPKGHMPFNRACRLLSAGRSSPARIAMIAITTSNSISVKKRFILPAFLHMFQQLR